jgi:hypothetical protein
MSGVCNRATVRCVRPVLESLATLHIYGRSDEIISADRSAAFAELFPNKQAGFVIA